MESRKFQLQKQIIEALKANDNNLYSLLKSQWAHRFGVESLEELKKLELEQMNQNPINEDNQKNDQLQDYLFEDNQEIEIKNDNKKVVKSVEVENKESFEIKSHEKVYKENPEKKDIKQVIEYKIHPKVQALIPLPPKPKYSYLKKWLLRSKL